MKYESILFDLDGTLTQSHIGITRCVKYAYETMHKPLPKIDLRVFVGPPLRDTFQQFGMSEEESEEAIKIFRSRYTTIGKFENNPYDGIEEVLKKLKENGHHLYVATSKPEKVAKEIIEHFHLDSYFEEVAGASFDTSRETKSAVISYLLDKIQTKDCIMVGDTNFDVLGAKELGIDCIGVSWGYGSKESMIESGAIKIVDTMDELYETLNA